MKLLSTAIERQLPTPERVKYPDPKIPLRLFDPCGSFMFYVWGKEKNELYGAETGNGKPALVSYPLEVLQSFRGPLGLGLERDTLWRPQRLSKALGPDKAAKLMLEATGLIYVYTSAQAFDDGVLVDLRNTDLAGKHINIVTRAVWDNYQRNGDHAALRGLMEYAENHVEFHGGVRELTLSTGQRFLVGPNEIDGYTLMFPSDY